MNYPLARTVGVALAVSELTEALKTARGKRYVGILLELNEQIGPEMAAKLKAVRDGGGKVTILEIAKLAVSHDLNLKATFDILEWQHALFTGTYDMCKRGGMKATYILTKAREALALESVPTP